LPFGTSSSSAIFQAFISQVLQGIKGVIVYQDDILIMSVSEEAHLTILDQVLERLQTNGVKINHEKSSYLTNEVTYLGYIFNEKGVSPIPNKINTIMECGEPKNVKEVQCFVGLTNYYSRFIKNYSTVMAPLYKLLKKNVKFEWLDEQNICFQEVKKVF
jgi:hypothetical protein